MTTVYKDMEPLYKEHCQAFVESGPFLVLVLQLWDLGMSNG